MQRLTAAERQKRIDLARDAALRLVRPQYNIEIDGELQRVPRTGQDRLLARMAEWEPTAEQLQTGRMGARDAPVSKNAQRNARVISRGSGRRRLN